jgi:hypothetical protein
LKSVEVRDASLPVYELGSGVVRRIESLEIADENDGKKGIRL